MSHVTCGQILVFQFLIFLWQINMSMFSWHALYVNLIETILEDNSIPKRYLNLLYIGCYRVVSPKSLIMKSFSNIKKNANNYKLIFIVLLRSRKSVTTWTKWIASYFTNIFFIWLASYGILFYWCTHNVISWLRNLIREHPNSKAI